MADSLDHLNTEDLDLALHTTEAIHLAHQSHNLADREAQAAALIQDTLYGPIREVSLALEFHGTNYRDNERILRKYIGDAIAEITGTLD